MAWMVVPSVPAFAALLPASTGMFTLTRNRIDHLRWWVSRRLVGLDDDTVWSWTGWYQRSTLALWALALLTVLRAGAIARGGIKKTSVVRPTGPPSDGV